jgi:hypothetical protein
MCRTNSSRSSTACEVKRRDTSPSQSLAIAIPIFISSFLTSTVHTSFPVFPTSPFNCFSSTRCAHKLRCLIPFFALNFRPFSKFCFLFCLYFSQMFSFSISSRWIRTGDSNYHTETWWNKDIYFSFRQPGFLIQNQQKNS